MVRLAAGVLIGHPDSVKAVVLDLLLLKPLNPSGWYMTCILFWYGVFWLSHKLCGGKYKLWLVGAASAAVLLLGNELWAEQAPMFLLGMLLADRETVRRIFWKKGTLPACAAVFALSFVIKQLPAINAVGVLSAPLQMFYKGALALICIRLAHKAVTVNWLRPAVKAASLLGTISFEVYLVNGYFEWYARTWGWKGILLAAFGSVLLGGVFFAATALPKRLWRKRGQGAAVK